MWSCCHEMQKRDNIVEQAMNLMKYNFLSLWLPLQASAPWLPVAQQPEGNIANNFTYQSWLRVPESL